jgi:hypothetical protein
MLDPANVPPALHDVFAAFRSWFDFRSNTPSEMDNLPPEQWMEGMMLQSFLAGVSVGATLTKKYEVDDLLPNNMYAKVYRSMQ